MPKKIQDICLIVQARTQSTRVPNKMLRPFADSSLLEICIKKILDSKILPKENFYLSVMDEELIELADKHSINTFIRSEESTQEPVTIEKVFEWWDKLPYKYYVIVNACNPLLSIETLDSFLTCFTLSDNRGMFGVMKKHTFMFSEQGQMLNRFSGEDKYLTTLETKFVEPFYEAAHTLYAGTMEDIGKGVYMGSFKEQNSPEFFEIPEQECFDVDFPWQFEMAEKIYKS